MWEIMFSVRDSEGGERFDKVKTDQAHTVFAAVSECLQTFIQSHKPSGLSFSAKEPSRQKLYRILVQKIATKMGWELHIEDEGDKIYYVAFDPKVHGAN